MLRASQNILKFIRTLQKLVLFVVVKTFLKNFFQILYNNDEKL